MPVIWPQSALLGVYEIPTQPKHNLETVERPPVQLYGGGVWFRGGRWISRLVGKGDRGTAEWFRIRQGTKATIDTTNW